MMSLQVKRSNFVLIVIILSVIARSEATWQSHKMLLSLRTKCGNLLQKKIFHPKGLPRRFAPRNDTFVSNITSNEISVFNISNKSVT